MLWPHGAPGRVTGNDGHLQGQRGFFKVGEASSRVVWELKDIEAMWGNDVAVWELKEGNRVTTVFEVRDASSMETRGGGYFI
jgi:hypothetical protein